MTVLLAAYQAQAQPAPLNPSIILFDEATIRRAPALVDRAAELGNRRVQVVVKVHCRLTPEFKVTEYGLLADRRLQWKTPLHPANFLPVDDQLRAEFTERLAAVFRRAVRNKLDLAVLPHLDAYGRVTEWRNRFDFDPLEKHHDESYASALIKPIVDALNRSITRETGVQFSLSGEMGRSLFAHPDRYERLAAEVRRRVKSKRLEVGVSLNHNDVASTHKPTGEQRAVLRRLFSRLDFVGFSHYRPFEPPPRVEHFTSACAGFLAALRDHEIDLPEATPLHFSEVAIGGAPSRNGEATPRSAAEKPWEGTGEPRCDPWQAAPMRELRRRYHDALLTFLQTQPGPRRVAAAYLWSENSWDPQGVDGRRFADEQITEAIRRHNTAIGSQRSKGQGR